MPPKRKATSPVRPSPFKRRRSNHETDSHEAETTGTDADAPICASARYERGSDLDPVNRTFYPSEVPIERCEQYATGQRPRPFYALRRILEITQGVRDNVEVGDCVVHWFKRDIRKDDNRALSLAGQKAKSNGVPLVGVFLGSPEDHEAHSTSAAQVDFVLRSLDLLREELGELDVPLYVETVEKRRDVPARLVQMCREWCARHVFCNIEYEVDELRRETKLVKMCAEQDIDFTAVDDATVVPPAAVKTGEGKPYSVYSPFYRAWIKHLNARPALLYASPPLPPNPISTRTRYPDLFTHPIPPAPQTFQLSPDRQTHLAALWPAGSAAAQTRLTHFLTTKAPAYKSTRSNPSANTTSKLSPHLATGTLAARTAVRHALEANAPSGLDGGDPGLSSWVSELAWRDFYQHVLVHWPHVCMSRAFKTEYANIEWKYDDDAFTRWREGRTGYPLVDAGMRQLAAQAYMHNRVRMVCASFLAKHLLLDWRLGERYFMTQLVDGDFASNNGGWGFASSAGVDPQPFFRVFNPVLQAETFDPEGGYVRRWVPELEGVEGKAVFDPYGRGGGERVEARGYPRMMVEHKEARDRALAVFREGLGRGTANVGGGVHN